MRMARSRSTLEVAIEVFVFLAFHRRLVMSLAACAVILMAGITTCRHLQKTNRATARLDSEFNPLGKSIDLILSHEGGSLAPKITGAIAYQISRKIDREGVSALSEVERRYHAICQLRVEARTHGFENYFASPAGDDTPIAVEALKEISAVRTAAVVERAMAAFPGGEFPRELSRRRAAIAESGPSARPVWQKCDEQIIWLDESIGRLLLAYAKKKRSEFVFR